MLPQQAEREADLVAEVEPIGAAHEALVGGVRGRQLGLVGGTLGQGRVERGGRGRLGQAMRRPRRMRPGDVLVAQAAEERDQRGQEARRVAERAVSVQRQLEQMLAQEDDLLGARRGRSSGR